MYCILRSHEGAVNVPCKSLNLTKLVGCNSVKLDFPSDMPVYVAFSVKVPTFVFAAVLFQGQKCIRLYPKAVTMN